MSKYFSYTIKLLLIALITIQISPAISARSLQEVEAEIANQQDTLSKTQQELSQVQSKLDKLTSSLNSVKGDIPKLKAQIKKLEAEIEINQIQLNILKEDESLKQLELEQRDIRRGFAINNAYRNWKTSASFRATFPVSGANQIKSRMYQAQVLSLQTERIDDLSGQIDSITAEISEFESDTASLMKKNADLKREKQKIERQLAALQSSVNYASGTVAGLQGDITAIQANIKQLSKEQKAILEYEAWLLKQKEEQATEVVETGDIYFAGVGRDLYQGHGVGMSQFGAYKAGLSGWTADQILTYYYPQTAIQTRSDRTVNVQGYGTMDVNKYVAGLGEVPSKACGTAEQVANDDKGKYVIDNPSTVWDCWPEEAIKAQVIAARTYALHVGGTICTTASCQVYAGGSAKEWAADETKDQVIISRGSTHNGIVILALYSSDNNQGGNGTANSDTIFSDYRGNGTYYSYLRHVDIVPQTNYNASHTNWTWRTNGYTTEQLTQMLQWAGTHKDMSHANSFFNTVLNQIGGEVTNITIDPADRDPSSGATAGRIKRITFHGPSGTSKVAGWLFKATWNSWVYRVKPSGQLDYIYSLSFNKVVK